MFGLSQSLGKWQQDVVIDYTRRIRQPAGHDTVNAWLASTDLREFTQERRTQGVPEVGNLGLQQRMVVF